MIRARVRLLRPEENGDLIMIPRILGKVRSLGIGEGVGKSKAAALQDALESAQIRGNGTRPKFKPGDLLQIIEIAAVSDALVEGEEIEGTEEDAALLDGDGE